MLHRLADSKPSGSRKSSDSSSHLAPVARANSDRSLGQNGTRTSQSNFQMSNIVIPRQTRPSQDSQNGAGDASSVGGSTRAFSTVSAPVGSSGNEFVQLSHGPRAASFRSAGSNSTQSNVVPILSAEETVERSTSKHSGHGSPKSESPSKKKNKKESRRETRERRDSVKFSGNGPTDTSSSGTTGENRVDASLKKKQGSMRRRGSVHSDQGSKKGALSVDGSAAKDDREGLLSDEDDGPRPLSRHASTLSMRQQNALAKTPSFLSRKHTPPPKLMREVNSRRRRQVHATTPGNAPTDDDETTASSTRPPSGLSPTNKGLAMTSSANQSNIVDVFHLPDVESLESSRHLLKSPSLPNSKSPGGGTSLQSSLSCPTPTTMTPYRGPMGISPSASHVVQHPLNTSQAETEAKKIPPPGRAMRTPSLGGASSNSNNRAASPVLAPTATASASLGSSVKATAPSTTVPAPPARTNGNNSGAVPSLSQFSPPLPSVSVTPAAPSRSSGSLATGGTTHNTSLDSGLNIPRSAQVTSSLNSASTGFDMYVMPGVDSINNSLVMHQPVKVVKADRTVAPASPTTSPTTSTGAAATKAAATPSGPATAKPVVGDKVATVAVAKPVTTALSPAAMASPTRTAAKTSVTPTVSSPSAGAKTTLTQASSLTRKRTSLTSDNSASAASPTPDSTALTPPSFVSRGSTSSYGSQPPSGAALPTAPPTPAAKVAAASPIKKPEATGSSGNKNNSGNSAVTHEPQPAKRGPQNSLTTRTATTAVVSPKPSAAAAPASPKRKVLSPSSSDDNGRSPSTPPIMMQRRSRQVNTILDDDEDVFTSSSAAPQHRLTHTMNLATPTASPPDVSPAKRTGVAALQALGINISLDDDDDDDDEEEDDEEGLLDGFHPEGFDAKRGHRRSSAITLFLADEDVEESDSDNDRSRTGAESSRMGFSAYNVSLSNVGGAPPPAEATASGVPCPRVQVRNYVPAVGSTLSRKLPALPVSGNPYASDGGATPSNRLSRRPTRTTRPSSRTSRTSACGFDQSYGFGLDGSTSSLASSPATPSWKLPPAQPGIFLMTSDKYKADPTKTHRPIANTFGRRRGAAATDDEDDEDEEGEYDYEFDEEGDEWYWEEVEEDEEEEDEEEDNADGAPVIVKVPDRRSSD